MKTRKAKLKEAKDIQALIMHYARREHMLPRSLSEIYETIRNYFVCVNKGKIVGCCALDIDWLDLAEIKSLAVDEKFSGRGVGTKLVKECLKEAKQMEIKRVFVLTNKPLFFKKLEFDEVAKDDLPRKIWGECAKCAKFPECDETAMMRRLKKR